MWEPDPTWVRLAPPRAATAGVFRADGPDGPVVVKRLVRPPADQVDAHDPEHWAYWRREVEVARSGAVEATAGLRGPVTREVEESEDGATVVTAWVPDAGLTVVERAAAIGRFAALGPGAYPWSSRPSLPDRLRTLEAAGGWPRLAETLVAGVADLLWRQRDRLLGELLALPLVASHGDPILANIRGRSEDGTVVAVDWSALGHHPVGSDLGLLLLASTEPLGRLVDAYRDGAEHAGRPVSQDAVVRGAGIMAAYTLLTRTSHACGTAGEEAAVREALRFEGMLEALVEV